MTALHSLFICHGPELAVVAAESAGVRWCFACRKRVEFTDRLWASVEPSYYDPHWARTCPQGHRDGDLGFGMSREWEW